MTNVQITMDCISPTHSPALCLKIHTSFSSFLPSPHTPCRPLFSATLSNWLGGWQPAAWCSLRNFTASNEFLPQLSCGNSQAMACSKAKEALRPCYQFSPKHTGQIPAGTAGLLRVPHDSHLSTRMPGKRNINFNIHTHPKMAMIKMFIVFFSL